MTAHPHPAVALRLFIAFIDPGHAPRPTQCTAITPFDDTHAPAQRPSRYPRTGQRLVEDARPC
jgi:hypothetical protein